MAVAQGNVLQRSIRVCLTPGFQRLYPDGCDGAVLPSTVTSRPSMLDKSASPKTNVSGRPRLDLQQHLADLEAAGLLTRIDRPINKDTELNPLVRWQFIGGVPEEERRAFLF